MAAKKKIKIGVIFGGRSGEHEVSLVSGESVLKNLDRSKFQPVPIGITKEGKWLATGDPLKAIKTGKSRGITQEVEPVVNPTRKGFLRKRNGSIISVDVVFPVLHGTYGEDGAIQGLFEMANIPYVGAGVLGSSIGMDKVIQKQIFNDNNLSLVKYYHFLKHEWGDNSENILRYIEKEIKYPSFVKPANLGSSVGISKAKDKKSLIKAIRNALKYDRKVIVEEALEKIKEIECGVLGNDHPEASLPGEIISSGEFYDYNAKYINNKSDLIIPSDLPLDLTDKIQNLAIRAFQTLDLCGMARVDFFLVPKIFGDKRRSYKIYLNEVNTIPGFTQISMYPKLWEATGLPYTELLTRLIKLAIEKHEEKMNALNSFIPKVWWYK